MLLPGTALDIHCPRCGGRAAFDEAFAFLSSRRVDPADAEGLHRWGGWLVREKYPSLVRWKAPRGSHQFLTTGREPGSGAYRLWHRGVVRCAACHHVGVHVLRWPADAYFQWDVRGTRLWAWNEEHARVLLEYVESLLRDPSRYPGFSRSLRRLPAAVLASRNRAVVARKIRGTLAALDPPRPR